MEMSDKPPEDGYISVVDDEPVFFELLKWDSTQSQKQPEPRSLEKAKSPEKSVPKPRDESDPFDLSDAAFVETYRLSKILARSLCEELKPVMPESTKSIEFSVESKRKKFVNITVDGAIDSWTPATLPVSLENYAQLEKSATISSEYEGKYQKSIGGKTDPSITQYFVSTAVMQVTEAMNHPNIVKKYIHFPHLRNEREVIKNGFYMKYGIPNVVGCVDCMHVPIARPDDDQKKHFNKSYHSKKVQIICDSNMNIISADARPGGSQSHDAILSQHAVTIDLQSLNQARETCWLLGGPHYFQKIYLMTPVPKITKKSPLSPEKYYTNMHTQAHSMVTETIKQLKSRWKCLQATCNKQFDPSTVSMMIVACCVLHNICNAHGLPVVQMNATEERLEAMKQRVANASVPRKHNEDASGMQARSTLIERLWNERRVAPETCSNSKKRMSKKDRIVEPVPPQQHHIHTMPPQHQTLHEDPKRPRILMNNPYGLGVSVPPPWPHYPQH